MLESQFHFQSFFSLFLATATTIYAVPAPLDTPAASHLYSNGAVIFAPYADIGSGFKPTKGLSYSLGFVNADCSTFKAVVAQGQPLDSIKPLVDEIKNGGGVPILSLGGALQSPQGSMPAVCAAQASKSPQQLADLYQSFVDFYAVSALDFDIEGANAENKASVDLRSKALALFQAKNPSVAISFTLPVAVSGLVESGLNNLKSAQANGVRLDIVNIMAMDYGGPISDMGKTAIAASEATIKQIASISFPVNPKLGITPMTGVNDVVTEVFSPADATTLVTWATSKKDQVGFLSFWSVNRDSSGEFSKIFSAFASGSPAPPSLPPSTSKVAELPPSSNPSTSAPDTPAVSVKQAQASDLNLADAAASPPSPSTFSASESCSVATSTITCASSTSYAQCAPAAVGDGSGSWVVRSCAVGTRCEMLAALGTALCM